MRIRINGSPADRRAEFRDGSVEIAFRPQRETKTEVGLRVFGFDPESLAIFRDGLVELALYIQAATLPEMVFGIILLGEEIAVGRKQGPELCSGDLQVSRDEENRQPRLRKQASDPPQD
jgi:hypothetical protein